LLYRLALAGLLMQRLSQRHGIFHVGFNLIAGKVTMNLRSLLLLLVVSTVAGCKAPPPKITDDTIVTSQVNGVTLTHRHIVVPPKEFNPVNDEYRAMYPGSILSKPDFSGKVLGELKTGETYVVLGFVEQSWLAISTTDNPQLLGYVPQRALVLSERYEQALKSDRPRPKRAAKKSTCVAVDNSSKACQKGDSGTWIID